MTVITKAREGEAALVPADRPAGGATREVKRDTRGWWRRWRCPTAVSAQLDFEPPWHPPEPRIKRPWRALPVRLV